MAQDDCSVGIGPKGCTGTPTVDFVAIALLAARAATRAAEGEDWRTVFRIRPDGYEQYREMQARQAATRP